MKTYLLEGTITALTSIQHGGESLGTTSLFRREKFVLPDGTIEELPVISGNTIRKRIRTAGMMHMLTLLGYGQNGNGLGLGAFYFLFSGGSLTSKGGMKTIDLAEARRWRETIPLLSLFGGAVGNRVMEGKLKVGKAIPICHETVHLLPEWVRGETEIKSIWDYLQIESYTRTDDAKRETMQALIAPADRKMLEDMRKERQRQVEEYGDYTVERTGEAQQMRYHVETIAAGTRFYWEVSLDDVTPLEWEAFCVALAEWARNPFIGARSAVGHGRVAVHFKNWIEIDPRVSRGGKELAQPLGNLYMDHLRTHADDIRQIIDSINSLG